MKAPEPWQVPEPHTKEEGWRMWFRDRLGIRVLLTQPMANLRTFGDSIFDRKNKVEIFISWTEMAEKVYRVLYSGLCYPVI